MKTDCDPNSFYEIISRNTLEICKKNICDPNSFYEIKSTNIQKYELDKCFHSDKTNPKYVEQHKKHLI